jgi:hypothetical protein
LFPFVRGFDPSQIAERQGNGEKPSKSEVKKGLIPWHETPTLKVRHPDVGSPMAVQQKLMRHSDIRTTMKVFGDVVRDEMAHAHSKVVGLALNRQMIAN